MKNYEQNLAPHVHCESIAHRVFEEPALLDISGPVATFFIKDGLRARGAKKKIKKSATRATNLFK